MFTVNLPVGSMISVFDGTETRMFILTAGTDAEDSPAVIRPDDFADPDNAKVWKLRLSSDPEETGYSGGGGGDDGDWNISGSDMHSALSGNVGIGTTSPTNKLQVEAGADTAVYATGSADAVGYFNNTATSTQKCGVYGECANTPDYGIGGWFVGGWTGVGGEATMAGSSENVAVRGAASDGVNNYGVKVYASSESGTNAYGYYCEALGTGTNWAAYFNAGDVYIKDNVGIGTTTPLEKLTVSNGDIKIENTGTARLILHESSTPTSFFMRRQPTGFLIDEGGIDRLFIANGTGNIGIGTTTPHSRLHVQAYDDTVGVDDGVFISVSNICDDSSAISGIRFKTRGTTDSLFYKGAIAFQRTTPQGRGNILFLNNNRANNTNADISDVTMTITPAGDVGIGTTTPSAKVEIASNSSSTTPTLLLHETEADAARIRFTNDDTTTYFTISAKPADTPETSRYTTYFYTTPIISFMGDGNVGIGTLSPAAKLDVSGITKTTNFMMPTGAANGFILQSDASGNASWANPNTISDGDWTVDGDDMYSAVSGNVGIGLNDPNATLQVCGDFEVVTGDYYMYVTDRSTVITYSNPRLPCDVSYGVDCPDTVITNDLGLLAYDQFTFSGNSRSYVYNRVGAVNLTVFGVDTTAGLVDVNADMDIAGDVGITGKVGIGTRTPARRLHVSDIMRLEPRPTAPSSPSEGDMYMNSTTHKLMVYDGTTWQACW